MKKISFKGSSNILFPGSFNPLHEGHLNIGRYVHNKYKTVVDFEISVNNVDKPSITEDNIQKRIEIFQSKIEPWFGTLWITESARFLEKAKIFPSTLFVIGYDTLERLCEKKYYTDKEKVFETFEDLGIKWLVFPRHKENGNVSDVSDFALFPEIVMRNVTVAWDFMPLNISSTMIRNSNVLS